MTIRHYDKDYLATQQSYDYRGLPVLFGTLMYGTTYQNNASMFTDLNLHGYKVVRNLTLFKNLKKALVNKEFWVDVEIESCLLLTPGLYKAWENAQITTVKNLRAYTKVLNMCRAMLENAEPMLSSAINNTGHDLTALFKSFRQNTLARVKATRKSVKLPLPYILDHMFFAYEREAHFSTSNFQEFYYAKDMVNPLRVDLTYYRRNDFKKNKNGILAMPAKYRPRNFSFKDKATFLKDLFNTLFSGRSAKVRRLKTQAKKTIYLSAVNGYSLFYFDLDDTDSIYYPLAGRNNRENMLVPTFFRKEGIISKCLCCNADTRTNNMSSVLLNSHRINEEVNNYKNLRAFIEDEGISRYDMEDMARVLQRFGTVPYTPITLPEPPVPAVRNPIPELGEFELSFENHIHRYLTADYTRLGGRPVSGVNPLKALFANSYSSEEIPPAASSSTHRMWYLKGRSLISENQRYSTDLINVVSTPSSPIPPVTWDTTHLREWLFAKGFGEGLFGGICSLCYQAIADAYVVPSSFALSNDGRTILEDGPRNYRTGPNVIRNYSANPLEFHQGFKTLETERRAYVSTVDWGKLLLRNKNAIRGDIIDSTMYLGIELEVTPNRNTFDYLRYRFGQSTPPDFQREGTNFASSIAERFLRKKALGIVKSDSSTQYGFEIVTVPGTLAWHRQQWQGFFKEDYPLHLQFLAPASWMAGWVNNGLTIKRPPWVHQDTTANHITPYCGIHIHVSRASLTPLQFGKILTFMGDPKNASFVQTIAGRKDSDYAKFYPKKISEGYKLNPSLINTAANLGRTGVSTYDDRRYSAVNIVSDKPTIEFRIFRSNIAKGGFMKNLDFVHAFCTWCKNVSMQELNVSHFIKFVEENKGTYPWLYRYLVTTKQTDSKHKFNPAVAFNLEEHI